jgi:hypothetical protein
MVPDLIFERHMGNVVAANQLEGFLRKYSTNGYSILLDTIDENKKLIRNTAVIRETDRSARRTGRSPYFRILPDSFKFPAYCFWDHSTDEASEEVETPYGVLPHLVKTLSGDIFEFSNYLYFNEVGDGIRYDEVRAGVSWGEIEVVKLPIVVRAPQVEASCFNQILQEDRVSVRKTLEAIEHRGITR